MLNEQNAMLEEKMLREVEIDEFDEIAMDRQWYDADEGATT